MVRANLALSADTTAPPTLMEMWDMLNALCLKNMTSSQCASLIGTYPVHIPTETCIKKEGLPWWAFMVLGFVVAKNI